MQGTPMIDAGAAASQSIKDALACIPDDIWIEWKDRLAFICKDDADACRLTHSFCNDREIIVLSERIIPRGPLCEDHLLVRYFNYIVLHEVAHAVCNHKPPHEIGGKEGGADKEQEKEADTLACGWLNEYFTKRKCPTFSAEELAQSKARAARITEETQGHFRKLQT